MRRLLVTTLVLLVVVGGGLYAMDRVSANYAESQVAKQVSNEVAARKLTSQAPAVEVGGFPFLTQVIGGRYEQITINLRDLSNGQLTLPLLTIVATDVDAPLDKVRAGEGPITASKVTGESTVPWSAIVTAVGAKGLVLSGDDSGKVHVSGAVTLGGLSVPLTGGGTASVSNGRVRFAITELTTTDANVTDTIQGLIDQYKSRLSYEFSVPKLPYDLKLTEVRATVGGVRISGVAVNVPLVT
ncbi:hypothetical protein F4553_004012 [Allocatelliglobosispora scoriae]|uniref:DUF2993 domain-containing protein n=1 Tax=Allocatelliglobosispora scoriae TaxID=643052 RepID=A0A841BUP2_9ACTN|nr:DUF2993 domain-containing protein [Allocatelliglobosispora scoriae]MBB5870633.1 hypothetical protein [Allocatelliglobosispora scoriae]